MSAVTAAPRIGRLATSTDRRGDALNGGMTADVVSLAQARRRLRGRTAAELDRSVANHPAGSRLRERNGVSAPPLQRRVPAAAFAVGVAAVRPQSLGAGRVRLTGRPTSASSTQLGALLLPQVRRLVTVALAIFLLFASALGLGLLLRPAPYSGETWNHSVASGESVWGIAGSLQLERPLEDVVEDIVSLNELGDMTIHAGQTLVLPAE